MRYFEKYYLNDLGIEITKLKVGLQNTIKEHSLLIKYIIEDRSFHINEKNYILIMKMNKKIEVENEMKLLDLNRWEIVHSGYLVFLSEALQVSR